MNVLSKAKIGVYSIAVICIALFSLLIVHYKLPLYLPPPPPSSCPLQPGCPAVPCEIPPFCRDSNCPFLAQRCPVIASQKSISECYNLANQSYPDALVSSCAVSSQPTVSPPTFFSNLSSCLSTAQLMDNIPGFVCSEQNPIIQNLPKVLEGCDEPWQDNLCLVCAGFRGCIGGWGCSSICSGLLADLLQNG
eukprot:Pgem_evm1s12386